MVKAVRRTGRLGLLSSKPEGLYLGHGVPDALKVLAQGNVLPHNRLLDGEEPLAVAARRDGNEHQRRRWWPCPGPARGKFARQVRAATYLGSPMPYDSSRGNTAQFVHAATSPYTEQNWTESTHAP